MGQPVVHFEIMGQDGEALKRYYGELFGWEIDSNNPMNYGIIDRERNLNADGIGIGGGIGQMPEGMGTPGALTFYVEVPDVEASLSKAESMGGTRAVGPMEVMDGLVIGVFLDPENHPVGVMSSSS
jgi:predicted enzyme related to lactoylglutathione lyase